MDSDICKPIKVGTKQVGAIAQHKNGLYVINFKYDKSCVNIGRLNSELSEWHSKMVHQDVEQVKNILKRRR